MSEENKIFLPFPTIKAGFRYRIKVGEEDGEYLCLVSSPTNIQLQPSGNATKYIDIRPVLEVKEK